MLDHSDEEQPEPLVACSRCAIELKFLGTKSFHEGTRGLDLLTGLDATRVSDVVGKVLELLTGRMRFDLYCCPRCGRAELFVAGIGESLRKPVEMPITPLLFPGEAGPSGVLTPEWTCANCGEGVPRNFEMCWKCSSPRPGPGE